MLADARGAAAGAPRERAPGTATPHQLPARHAAAAAAQPATWLVGARPGSLADRVAHRHGAVLVSARGTFAVHRAQARRFANALRAVGVYRWAEPSRRLASQQAPPGGDEFAATDWRAALLGAGLAVPPVLAAPMIAVVDSAVDATHPDLAGVDVIGDPSVGDPMGRRSLRSPPDGRTAAAWWGCSRAPHCSRSVRR
jgi:hypothetical protein